MAAELIIPPALAAPARSRHDARRSRIISEALDAARDYLTRFVAFPAPEAADAVALYALYTHVSDRFDVAPRLWIESAEKGCGKTTLRRALEKIAARPMMMSRATGAAMYHSLGLYDPAAPRGSCPTLFLDEMDTVPQSSLMELSGVVNAGFEAGEPIRRASGRSVESFNTFGPAVIAGIELKLAESTLSRSIRIVMRRGGADQLVRPKRIAGEADLVRRRLARAAELLPADMALLDAEPRGLAYRELDKWEPLLLVAGHAAGGWPDRAYKAAAALEPRQAATRDLLADLACLLGQPQYDTGFIASRMLLDGLLHGTGHDDWREAGLNVTSLGRRLAAYDVHPVQQSSGSRARGYKRADLEAAVAAFRP